MDEIQQWVRGRVNEATASRAQLYILRRRAVIVSMLGFGSDGIVLETDGGAAMKAFEREASYRTELAVYRRLAEHRVEEVCGHNVPQLLGHDDELWVIEMSIVQPPYVLDFAKAALDAAPDFPEEAWAEQRRSWAERFGDHWPAVLAIMAAMRRRYGIFLLDPSPTNVAF